MVITTADGKQHVFNMTNNGFTITDPLQPEEFQTINDRSGFIITDSRFDMLRIIPYHQTITKADKERITREVSEVDAKVTSDDLQFHFDYL